MSPYNQKQVIYLISSPLSLRDFKRYGVQNWIDHGWKVKVFDITRFLNPKFWSYVDGDKLNINFEGLTIFHNINEILSAISNLQNKVVFLDYIGFSNTEIKIRKIASMHGILIKSRLGSVPQAKTKINFLNLFSLIIHPINFVNKLTSFIKHKVEKIRSNKCLPDYLVVSGSKSMSGINDKKTSIIKAHNFDYDLFIEKKQIAPNKKSNSLVFLDEDGSYHSDYYYMKIKPFVTADKYYPVIDLGLDKIADSLKLNIKIAAHPRSDYNVKKIRYKHPTIKNETFELIKDADVIVGHGSIALQLAVIMKKPIIFVTTDEIQNASYAKPYAKLIDHYAKTLGKKVINLSNLSNLYNWRDYLNVDEEKYEKYIETYIKTKGSPEKLISNIIIEYIEKDLLL